jgi:hypothetical protein
MQLPICHFSLLKQPQAAAKHLSLYPFIKSPNPLLCVLLCLLLGLLIKCISSFVQLRGVSIYSVFRNGFDQELLSCSKNCQDLARRLPRIAFEDSQAHQSGSLVGHVWVVDGRLELELGGFEGIIGGKLEFEFELAALYHD